LQRRLVPRDLLDPIDDRDFLHVDLRPLQSRLTGPGPQVVTSSRPPIRDRLCSRNSICTFCCSGGYVQKARWNVAVTGIRYSNSTSAPSRAWSPSSRERPAPSSTTVAATWKNGIQNMPRSAIWASVPDQSTIFITPLRRKL